MEQIKDFQCTYDYAAGIDEAAIGHLKLSFPDAYLHCESMVQMAQAIKDYEGAGFCILPFCHTVEAEAMGGSVNYGNQTAGPRAREYICTNVEELLQLPSIDYTRGRITEVLRACRYLRGQGEDVVLEIAGPFTILNVLIDAKYIYKAMRRQPELMNRVFEKIKSELLCYIGEAVKNGVNLISYADSSGGVNILGPQRAADVVRDFTYDFLCQAERIIHDRAIIALCPKTTFALLGLRKAMFSSVDLKEDMPYGKGCVELIGKESFTGQTCIKNIGFQLKNQEIKAVRLL